VTVAVQTKTTATQSLAVVEEHRRVMGRELMIAALGRAAAKKSRNPVAVLETGELTKQKQKLSS
jgi:hypothetical protein